MAMATVTAGEASRLPASKELSELISSRDVLSVRVGESPRQLRPPFDVEFLLDVRGVGLDRLYCDEERLSDFAVGQAGAC